MPLDQDNFNVNSFNIKPAKKLAMGHGWQWINEGFRYFTYSKYIWMSTLLILVFSVMLMIYLVPILQLVLIILLPLVTAGLGLACHEIEKGNKINVVYLIKGFVHPSNVNLIRYGFWLILLMIIAQMFGSMILMALGISQETVAGELQRLTKSSNPTLQSIVDSPVLVKYLVISFVMMLPITAINIFSPYLLIFSKLSALDSIKYSVVAVIKNISAIALYAFIYLFLIFVVFLILKGLNGVLFSLFSQDSIIAPVIDLVVTMIAILFIASLSYCSAYVAFKDTFLGEEI